MMKKLLSLLGALLAFSTLFSCSSDESETPAWKELSFTFAVAEPTSNSVEFSIMPDDQSLTYFAYYIKKASYVDDATLKADDRALVEQQAASKGITFEEALRQRLECGQTEGRFEELDPDTDYFIYAYRMDETGRADGAVARSEFRTQPAPEELVRFTFSTPVLEYTRMTVVTEASEPEVFYCTDLMEAADYEALGGGEGAVLEYFRQVASYTASSGGMTVEEFVRAMSVQGTDEYTYEDLTQDTEYYAYAVVVDAEGNISDRCAFEKFRTPAVEASDMTIAIEVSNIKPDQADVTTTPDNDDEFYLVNLFYADELTKFSSDQEIIDAMIQKFGPSVDSELKFGTRTQTFYELAPDTEWVVLAFGYESGVNTTGLFRRNFRTPATGAVVDLDFEIEVVPHQFKAEATYKPSMESVRYAYEIMPEDTYNEYGADAAAIQRYYDELIARLIEQLPSLTVRDVVYQITAKNEFTYRLSFLTPDKNYITWAAACDEEGKLQSEPVVKAFKTTPYVLSSETVTHRLEMYFDGGDVAEVDPYMGGVSSEVAVGYFRTERSENAVTTWTALYQGDYTSTSDYPDYRLAAKMENDGNKNVYCPIYSLAWDVPMTLCAVAIDAEGNYGPIQREIIKVNHEGVTPISEYPWFWPYAERPELPVEMVPCPLRQLDESLRAPVSEPVPAARCEAMQLGRREAQASSDKLRGRMLSPEVMRGSAAVRNWGRELR